MCKEIFVFMGKNIEEMNKEELIETVKILGKANQNLHQSFKSYSQVHEAAINYYRNK